MMVIVCPEIISYCEYRYLSVIYGIQFNGVQMRDLFKIGRIEPTPQTGLQKFINCKQRSSQSAAGQIQFFSDCPNDKAVFPQSGCIRCVLSVGLTDYNFGFCICRSICLNGEHNARDFLQICCQFFCCKNLCFCTVLSMDDAISFFG